MPTEFITKRGQYFVGEVTLASGTEAFVQRGSENGCWDRFVDGCGYCPATFA